MHKRQAQDAGENPYEYSVSQNLKDAGCADDMIEEFLKLRDGDDDEQKLRLLSCHRKHLLDKLHRCERRIDCLDYLIYQMGRRNRV